MKKTLILMLACLGGLTAMAEMPVNVGIHGGISSNRIRLRQELKDYRTQADKGFMVGAFMRVNFGVMYLEPALNYARQKSKVQDVQPAPGEKAPWVTMKNSTFEIPLMLGVRVLDLKIAKIRAFAGPAFSVGKLKNIKHLGNELHPDHGNWSGKVGVGVDLWKFAFDVDYEHGFHKMAPEVKAPRSFNFTLGLKII